MEMIKKKLSELVPADYNPRQTLHAEDKAWEKLNNSMEAFGLVEPIIWNRRRPHCRRSPAVRHPLRARR